MERRSIVATRKEFLKRLAGSLVEADWKVSAANVAEFYQIFCKSACETLAEPEGVVVLDGIGRLQLKTVHRKARTGRNPRTGEPVDLPAKDVARIVFRPQGGESGVQAAAQRRADQAARRLRWPDLVKAKGPVPAIQVIVDDLPGELEDEWSDHVAAALREVWAEADPEAKATVWSFMQPSCDFGTPPRMVMYLALAGLKQRQVNDVLAGARKILGSCVRGAGSPTVRKDEGWSPFFHLEGGEVWTPYEEGVWWLGN